LLAINWQAGVGDPLRSASFDVALAAAGFPVASVPEPGSILAMIGITTVALKCHGRRRRHGVT
jgi:hypothetical protein